MDEKLKANLTSSEHWTRFIYMLLFAVFLYIAILLAAAVVTVQFFFALLTGGPNKRLRSFGSELSAYMHQVWQFLMYNREEKAFPFADWPEPEAGEPLAGEQAEQVAPSSVAPQAPAAQAPPTVNTKPDTNESKKKSGPTAADESAEATVEATEKSDS